MYARGITALVIAGALALPVAASAQAPQLAPVYVGASLGSGTSTASGARLTVMSLVPKAKEVRMRLGFFTRCPAAPDPIHATQVLLHFPRDAAGGFKGKRTLKAPELGRVTITIDGTLTPNGGDGTLRVTSKGKLAGRCDTGERRFFARPVDPAAKPDTTGTVPGSALLLGLTDEGDGTPYPFAARTSPDGRRLTRVIYVTDEDGTYHYGSETSGSVWDIEHSILSLKIARNALTYRYDRPYRNRAKGFSGRDRGSFSAKIGAGGLTATASHHGSYREGTYGHQFGISGVHVTAQFVR